MKKVTLKQFLRVGILVAIVVAVAVVGYSSTDSPSSSASSATEPVAAPPATATDPVDALPTSEAVKTAIYERAFSECASYGLEHLAAKYKARVKTKESVAFVVGEAWTRYFKAGRDAVDDGRDGCLQGFSRQ